MSDDRLSQALGGRCAFCGSLPTERWQDAETICLSCGHTYSYVPLVTVDLAAYEEEER